MSDCYGLDVKSKLNFFVFFFIGDGIIDNSWYRVMKFEFFNELWKIILCI